ncbi:uncharacterized protein LOC121915349 [Sceloporus undulatus]|uniref:uncharacterized protein LOC121915349 n=1 Tax=Sceloporus undulatus TaxID=8520 RepID=UPI001C4CCCAB|nr:uncharacterized protein LOC121915349 [Sceloporus undulatus]
MFLAKDCILAWAVLQVQFSPHQSLQFQFVKVGDKAWIQFVPVGKPEDEGFLFFWFKKSAYEGIPLFITSCNDNKPADKFICKPGREKVTVEISRAQREDSGLYLYAERGEDFHLGSALVVGDSYTPRTQVMLLQPAAQAPSSWDVRRGQFACLVQDVSNLVEVSWDVPGGLWQKEQTFLVKNTSGSLTFLSLLHMPMEVQSNGGNVTCEVRFNSSGTSVKKSTTFDTLLQVQFSSYQPLQFQFVKVGDKAWIQFVPVGKPEDEGLSFFWYKRSVYEGIPLFITSCNDNKPADKFICKPGREKVTLEISRAQREDSGLYLYAERGEDFHLGSALVVGDSYTPRTQVMILQPAAHAPSSWDVRRGQLACLIQDISNLVEVSWDVPGGLRQKGQTFLVKNISGSLTFLSLLSIPMEVQSNGWNVTCEVKFNSSGTSMKTTLSPSSSEVHEEKCLPYIMSLAGFGGLMFLLLLLSFLWNHFRSSRPRCSSKISEPPCPDVTEEGLCYAQLDLARRTEDRKKRK